MDHGLRRRRAAERIEAAGVEALLVTHLPNVRYLTGFSGSSGQLVLAGDADRSVFLTDGRYTEQSRWEVPDLERRSSADGLTKALGPVVADLGVARLGFEGAAVTYETFTALASSLPTELVSVAGAVEAGRLTKDAEEIAALDHAQSCADAAFECAVLGGLREGITERELALELELEMRRAGADDRSFDTIVAFGENAAEPHHHPTDRPLARGDIVKLDFGAVAQGYHSDMTRTVALGEPPGRLREIRDLVAAAQSAGIAAVGAGVPAGDVDRAARAVVEAADLGAAFPHGLGHGVGLEIHEAPRMRWDAQAPLPAGAVVTIEPGVYIPGLGGVRIEDMVEVTADGCREIPMSTKELVVL